MKRDKVITTLLIIIVLEVALILFMPVILSIIDRNDSIPSSSEQARAYNEEFLQYEGTRPGTQVRTLIQNIQLHNRANTDDPSKQIQITNEIYFEGENIDALTETATYNYPRIDYRKAYLVTFAYDPYSSYITLCGIVEHVRGSLKDSLVDSNENTNTLTENTNTEEGVNNIITNTENSINSTD